MLKLKARQIRTNLLMTTSRPYACDPVAIKVGPSLAQDTTMGPLTVPQGLEKAVAHVEDAKKNGGKVLFGGNKVKIDDGYYFEPTMIVDAHEDLLIAREEVFAPVAAFFKFEKEEEAVAWANKTSVSPSERSVDVESV